VDLLAFILLVLCVVLVGAMWAVLVAGEQVAARVRVRASSDDA
jgi:hypothetical protein